MQMLTVQTAEELKTEKIEKFKTKILLKLWALGSCVVSLPAFIHLLLRRLAVQISICGADGTVCFVLAACGCER